MSGSVVFRNRLDVTYPTIAWSILTQAGASRTFAGQLSLRHDPVSGQIWYYGTDNNGIYSTAVFFAAVSGNTITFTKLSGTGGATACNGGTYPASNPGGWNNGDGAALQPWPADRHPDVMNAIDPVRGHLYQWSGLACNNGPAGDGVVYRDMWQLTLNTDPTDDTWVKKTIATKAELYHGCPMVYVPGHDVLVLHGMSGGAGSGFPETWVYAPTSGGTLSANQIAAGAGAADDWTRTYDGSDDTPPGSYYSNSEYDPVTDRVLLFRVDGASDPWTTTVWEYNLLTKAWTDRNPSNPPTQQLGLEHPQQLWTRVTDGPWKNKILFHRTNNATTGSGQAADYLYHPIENTFITLASTGTGPENAAWMTYIPTIGEFGALVATTTGNVWWKGALQ